MGASVLGRATGWRPDGSLRRVGRRSSAVVPSGPQVSSAVTVRVATVTFTGAGEADAVAAMYGKGSECVPRAAFVAAASAVSGPSLRRRGPTSRVSWPLPAVQYG